jgi:protein tyrosine phosphatase
MLRYHRYKVIVSLNDDRKEKEEKWKKGKSNS